MTIRRTLWPGVEDDSIALFGGFQICCPHQRWEGVTEKADIVRKVACILKYKSDPNVDKGGGGKSKNFVDIISGSSLMRCSAQEAATEWTPR